MLLTNPPSQQAASTGMPMWRVTAFIVENIIVFETRYEGLHRNCFRHANIRMEWKVYDPLLALPPDLQAARGLMCCALCTACIRDNGRAKRTVLIVAGSMILGACVCVIIPVSWTGHTIIRDFYNPLLIDAQRRELGEALTIGWVSSAFLFAGGCMFCCCNVKEDKRQDNMHFSCEKMHFSCHKMHFSCHKMHFSCHKMHFSCHKMHFSCHKMHFSCH
uniref:Claudin 8 n=1 Tax=Oncorhynchus tshawytscha TaxID=74940 RepID=A0A8C8CB65_ONCTS